MSGTSQAPSRKLIVFDLRQDGLRKYYPKPNNSKNPQYYKKAYEDIKNFMKDEGWEHRQGSGYTSNEGISDFDVQKLMERMIDKLPWINKCISKFDVADIGEQFDLREIIVDFGEIREEMI